MILPLGWLYEKFINLRNSRYERGTVQAQGLGAPTISIGNITVGGTGKTPLVRFVSEVLSEMGEKVCIISRGYKRKKEKIRVLVSDWEKVLANVDEAGDEPFELATKLLGQAIVISDADRVAAGNWAKARFGITAFVLDDAFQHRRARRDLDIIAVDASNPFGNRKVLPSGILREPLNNLRRADIVVITRTNLVENIDKLSYEIHQLAAESKIFSSENYVERLRKLQDFPSGDDARKTVSEKAALAFCALGNPENFFRQLKEEGFSIAATKEFRDHYVYKQSDIDSLEKAAMKEGARAFLTTPKDAVKLTQLNFSIPCYVVESGLKFDNEKKLRQRISAVFE